MDRMSQLLETPRLRLVPLCDEDREPFHALCARDEVRRYLFDGRDVARSETDAIVSESRASFDTRGFGLWGLRGPSAPDLLGFCGLAHHPQLESVEMT